jgi:hypothetical protein
MGPSYIVSSSAQEKLNKKTLSRKTNKIQKKTRKQQQYTTQITETHQLRRRFLHQLFLIELWRISKILVARRFSYHGSPHAFFFHPRSILYLESAKKGFASPCTTQEVTSFASPCSTNLLRGIVHRVVLSTVFAPPASSHSMTLIIV